MTTTLYHNPNVLNVAHHFIASLIGTIHQKILKHQQVWKFFALLQADGLQGKLMKMQSWQAVTAVEEQYLPTVPVLIPTWKFSSFTILLLNPTGKC